ncbi:hypothetical protein N752_16875 [Desulforamulus aquiferis]|nr:aminopeptidase P family N-terminal domain-containing protein [Desulforamulus aquiferis]RYD04064.1 hypothetical protein N752_16875 [Desulforamulus aquiferis]
MQLFDMTEYQQRLMKVKEKMNDQGIDVLLVTDPANMNYLTGYDGWSFYVHQLLIILLDEAQPIWLAGDRMVTGPDLPPGSSPITSEPTQMIMFNP